MDFSFRYSFPQKFARRGFCIRPPARTSATTAARDRSSDATPTPIAALSVFVRFGSGVGHVPPAYPHCVEIIARRSCLPGGVTTRPSDKENTINRHRTLLLAGAALAFAAVAMSPAYAEKNRYHAQALVSDGFVPGTKLDTHLVNGWGVAFNPVGFVWVADNGTGFATLYDGLGTPQSLVVSIPAAPGGAHGKPTGVGFSGSN